MQTVFARHGRGNHHANPTSQPTWRGSHLSQRIVCQPFVAMEGDDAPLLSSRLLRDLFAARWGIKRTHEAGGMEVIMAKARLMTLVGAATVLAAGLTSASAQVLNLTGQFQCVKQCLAGPPAFAYLTQADLEMSRRSRWFQVGSFCRRRW